MTLFRILSLLLYLIGLALPAMAAPATELRDITVTPGAASARVRFLVSARVATVVVEPKRGGTAQIRMKPMKASRAALGSARPKAGVVDIKAWIERKNVLITNVRFDRAVEKMQVISRTADSIVVLVTLGEKVSGEKEPVASGREESTGERRRPNAAARKWSLTTIVIDPGHGGKDPGAIGLHDVREKDVTLAVAKQLRREIKRAMPGVKVVMTRDGDEFVELFRRGQIANEQDGRLFISIHCNSMPEKPHPANGFECYIVRPGKSEEAARVAAAENGAIRFESDQKKYEEMDAESMIVASMAQSAFARYSEEAAQSIREALRKSPGLADRGVHQAGFFVLIGAAMPSVLVEIGYLSNEKDVKVLKSANGQKKIARALFQGIREYEKIYAASLR